MIAWARKPKGHVAHAWEIRPSRGKAPTVLVVRRRAVCGAWWVMGLVSDGLAPKCRRCLRWATPHPRKGSWTTKYGSPLQVEILEAIFPVADPGAAGDGGSPAPSGPADPAGG